jgi:hypothetical protein
MFQVRVRGREPDWAPVLAALDQLRDHIDKEEYGVFPAAVSCCRFRLGIGLRRHLPATRRPRRARVPPE